VTYPELVEFCGSERQAHFLSTRLPYQRMSESELTDAICNLMVRVKERTQRRRPNITLQYIGGIRRDTLRA